MTNHPEVPLKKKDFVSDQMVRWCPGCGDYAILSQVQRVMAELGKPREEYAVIAGIGCSSRFPYYMETYGFHTIHGRGPAFVSGLKSTRPDLSVWMVTGDGDGLSIGGNHLIHIWRRNIDTNILMFNNRIYGLTKGQYSPTSKSGTRTKSSPMGSIEEPFDPLTLALGAGAAWVARSVDVFAAHLRETLKEADAHRGTSFLEIYQNCVIFNDQPFGDVVDKKVRGKRVLYLQDGEPLVWGEEGERSGLVLNGFELQIIDANTDEDVARCVVHDTSNLILAQLLAQLEEGTEYPLPVGVFYNKPRPTYDEQFSAQVAASRKRLGPGDIEKLLQGGDTWTV